MNPRSFDAPPEAEWFMPAEWWPHTRCWMAWPTRVWGGWLEEARKDVAAVAQAITEFDEPVSLLASPDSAAEAAQTCGGKVEVLPMPIDDCWTRDTGPTFLVNDMCGCGGISWGFNGWGERYKPYTEDALLARRLLG